MKLLMSCYCAFAIACQSNKPPPQASSRTVDPMRDVVIIPQDVCPKFGGWIAKTQDAQILEEKVMLEQDRDYRLRIADAQGAQFLAESQRDRAIEELDKASWWSRWGLPIGVGFGVIVTGLAATGLILMKR